VRYGRTTGTWGSMILEEDGRTWVWRLSRLEKKSWTKEEREKEGGEEW